jgi:hypothetical protein
MLATREEDLQAALVLRVRDRLAIASRLLETLPDGVDDPELEAELDRRSGDWEGAVPCEELRAEMRGTRSAERSVWLLGVSILLVGGCGRGGAPAAEGAAAPATTRAAAGEMAPDAVDDSSAQQPAETRELSAEGFLGHPDDAEQTIQPPSALAGITSMTAVRPGTIGHYEWCRMHRRITAEETRDGFVYYATEEIRYAPFADGSEASVVVIERYRAPFPADADCPTSP